MTNSIKMVLEYQGKSGLEEDSFSVDSYTSPINDNFRNTLSWYFNDYLAGNSYGEDKSDVVGKLVKFGRYMGDELLGDDHQLLRFMERIDGLGYPNVKVQIESKRIEFFSELWEATILHEANYFLAGAAHSFTRRFVGNDFPTQLPDISRQLNTTPPEQDQVSKLLGAQSGQPEQPKEHNPLKVLYLVSRANLNKEEALPSNAIKTSIEAAVAGNIIEFDVCRFIDKATLIEKLKSAHVLHYDGSVVIEQGTSFLQLESHDGKVEKISIEELTQAMVANGVTLLNLDCRQYTSDGNAISASVGLASVAYSAQKQGLGNVVGLNEISNPWLSSQCFDTVYRSIMNGFSIAQAIVEARKVLQSNVESLLATPVAIPFHPWSLLAHYGCQQVTYFAGQQTPADPYESPELAKLHNKLYGFRSDMLPPLLHQSSDSMALSLTDTLLLPSSPIVAVTGERGAGKTQLTHIVATHLAQKGKIDYGFYYDFGHNDYSTDDLLEMIAPIVGQDVKDKAGIKAKLAQLTCLIVLDDLPPDEPQNTSWSSLSDFIKDMQSAGHRVVISSDKTTPLFESADQLMTLAPLSMLELKVLASQSVQQQRLPNIALNADWDNFLACLHGNPWLTKKALSLLLKTPITELSKQIEEKVIANDKLSKVDAFYEWQWAELDKGWQDLLLLVSEQKALLLETLMIAVDQKELFEPAKALFDNIGKEGAKFSEALIAWELGGFLNRFPHGRMVDTRVLPFLQNKREQQGETSNDKQQLQFSQLIAEGIRQLSQHVLKQPNPAISNNLLFNRRYWVKHFENLWFNEDYKGFIGVKHAFEQLLHQAKLIDESKQWSLDLLSRTPPATNDPEKSIESKLAWLMMAAGAMESPIETGTKAMQEAKDKVHQGAELWHDWYKAVDESIDQAELALFHQVAGFLEVFFRSNKEWAQCLEICAKAAQIYIKYEAWHRVIQAWRSQAKYFAEMGNMEEALDTENKIFSDIPYDEAPQGFRTQQMLEVLLARVARSATDAAQELLNDIRETDDAARIKDMLDGVQCDIYYQQENYAAALPYYCHVWARTLQSNQQLQIDQLRNRLLEIEEKLGSEVFNKTFKQETPEGTVKPRDYQSSLH
ncbi:hypothetical protein KIH87_12210 [Paraneptunicella aestuarii]|uniref:hypothetical protein n=1 Tax=Paraneptunicella aestuarii TaxID=2831148 RepID=UPI001E428999|nr:hypothetical protein [Paraneptunicella aestuarii]UAA37476.1 hypothetical protein KIH87_12210 [Paraneptunicella aestuarii]